MPSTWGGSSRGIRDDVTVLVRELSDLVAFELVVSFDEAWTPEQKAA
jgi:hypothetical protein